MPLLLCVVFYLFWGHSVLEDAVFKCIIVLLLVLYRLFFEYCFGTVEYGIVNNDTTDE